MNKVLIGIAASVLVVVGYFTFGNYSDGQRSGQVVKFSHKGAVPGCKTWEGELVMGGLRRNDGAGDSNANLWHFTVSNDNVAAKVQEKLEKGDYAILDYIEPFWNMPCTTDSGYFVTNVR